MLFICNVQWKKLWIHWHAWTSWWRVTQAAQMTPVLESAGRKGVFASAFSRVRMAQAALYFLRQFSVVSRYAGITNLFFPYPHSGFHESLSWYLQRICLIYEANSVNLTMTEESFKFCSIKDEYLLIDSKKYKRKILTRRNEETG